MSLKSCGTWGLGLRAENTELGEVPSVPGEVLAGVA